MNARTKFVAGVVCTLCSATWIAAQGPGGRVIVTLTPGTDPAAAAQFAADHGAVISHLLHHGYSGVLSARLISELRSDSSVSDIEPDQMVRVAQQQCTSQPTTSWGLDRISERALQLDGFYEYEYHGTGVNVYVLDTGIDTSNPDLGGRAALGVDEVDGAAHDCNGHGTAVAGTIGGTTYGVAKQVSLTSVRVLNCGGIGFDSDVVAGLEWATDDYLANRKPAVAVLAFEGPPSQTLNDAVKAAYQAGLGSVVAAGNDHADACNYSPASASGVLTVAASDITDHRASFSNGGACVGMFAPGVDIPVDWLRGRTSIASGTSISAAFVAGVAALTLEEHHTWSFDQVTQHLNEKSTKGLIIEPTDDCSGKGPHPMVCAPPSTNALVYSACDI